MSGQVIAAAIAAFTPIVRALIIEAENTGGSGAAKHAAVASGSEEIYKLLQEHGSIKEIRGVPWEAVAPAIIPVAGGIISIVVSIFNSLWGKVWGFFTDEGDEADG